MPTKLKRYSVSLPEEIQSLIEKDADFNRRPVSNQIMWILDQWFMERKKDFSNSSRLFEGETSGPIFDGPPPHPEHISKLHATLEKDNS